MAKEIIKIEADAAVKAAKEAEEKVAKIKEEKAAKKAARQAKRLEWKGPLKWLGKGINALEDHPVLVTLAFLAGIPVGILVVFLVNKFKTSPSVHPDDAEDLMDEALDSNQDEAPFDTDA